MTDRTTTPHARPNFLFVFPDQHRFDWLPDNPGLPLRMPHLQAVMERGVTFRNAFTPSPICAPARACLATGRSYDECGVPNNRFDLPLCHQTYYQALRSSGYHVSGVGKFDLHKATQDWGLDGHKLLDEWGFTSGIDNEGKIDAVTSGAERPAGPYMAFLHDRGLAAAHVADFARRRGPLVSYTATHVTPLPDDAYCDNWIAQNALAELQRVPVGVPWHLVVNFTGPHNPMDVTVEMRDRWAGVAFPGPTASAQFDDATHQAIRQRYAAMLENIDAQVGRLLAAVADRGELDRTIVIYSSDHGEMLGDHERWAKSTYYQPSIGVPLVMAGPAIRPAQTTDALVSLQDITATILDAAGAAPLPDMDGRSLSALLRGDVESHRSHVVSGLDGWRSVVDGRWKLVHGASPDDELRLFDLRSDPHELVDAKHSYPEEVRRLTGLLHAPSWAASSNIATSSDKQGGRA